MDIVHQLRESESSVYNAANTVCEAEKEDAPMQNGNQRDVDVSKNTHFEFQFGGDKYPEVYAYIERYDGESGIEVLIWADDAWFDDTDFEGYGPTIGDGGEKLEEFAETLLDIVSDVLDTGSRPQYEYHSLAPPSVVFSATFYL